MCDTVVFVSALGHMTNHPPLSSVVKSCRLSFFGHLLRIDENADASQVISEPPPESWRRPPGRPRTTWMKTTQGDLSSLDLELAHNRPLWKYSATHSEWCMLLLDWTGRCLESQRRLTVGSIPHS